MPKVPKAIVLSGDGINCEVETAHALTLAGFEPKMVHVFKILDEPELLNDCSLLVLPGGFSFGDEIESGKVLAIKLMEKIKEDIYEFVESKRLVLGICNGFQALVQMGLLPDKIDTREKNLSLLKNKNGKFINKWVDLKAGEIAKDGFMKDIDRIQLPVRHGEGRLAVSDNLKSTIDAHAALNYEIDINGSHNKIAGLTNKEGNVLGMMPHPEAFVRWTHHPEWTSLKVSNPEIMAESSDNIPHGLKILKNARAMAESL